MFQSFPVGPGFFIFFQEPNSGSVQYLSSSNNLNRLERKPDDDEIAVIMSILLT